MLGPWLLHDEVETRGEGAVQRFAIVRQIGRRDSRRQAFHLGPHILERLLPVRGLLRLLVERVGFILLFAALLLTACRTGIRYALLLLLLLLLRLGDLGALPTILLHQF